MKQQEVNNILKCLLKEMDSIKDAKVIAYIENLVNLIFLGIEKEIQSKIHKRLKDKINQLKANRLHFSKKSKKNERNTLLPEEIITSSEKLRLTLEAAQLGYWSLNLKTNQAECSLLHDQIYGYTNTTPKWTYDFFLTCLHPDDVNKVDKAFRATVAEKEHWKFEFRIYRADDKSLRWLWASGRPFEFDKTTYYLGVVQDITERKELELQVQKIKSKFNALFEAVPSCLFVTNRAGEIKFVNHLVEKVFGYSSNELMGQKIEHLIPLRFQAQFMTHHQRYCEHSSKPADKKLEISAKHKNGQEFPVEVSLSSIEDEEGTLITTSMRDITKWKKNEVQLEELAHFDLVTHLPNRVFFYDILKRAIRNHHRMKKEFALLYLDLDDFKKINDSFGHNLGDKYLEYASKKIRVSLKGTEFVARLGGDEFVVLIEEGAESLREATHLAKRIIEAFQTPYYLDNHELNSSISIGIVVYPSCGKSVSSLMKNADLAMYGAKRIGKNTYQFFSEELHKEYERQIEIESHLRHAIEHNEFSLVYQPQFSLVTGKIYGYEALLRWNTPSLGEVSPSEFIPIAENMGLISKIGYWVIENACQQFQTWSYQHPCFQKTSLVLSVNLSVLQLTQGDLASTLEKLMRRLQFNPKQLVLEVTETSIMSNVEASIQALNTINKLGIGMAIDDFGTGYSSLSYLKQLPFTALKIDQSFVQDVTENSNVASIVTAIIQLGFGLDLNIIAEGVETDQQLKFLKKAGCHYGQGYFLSYPLPPDKLIQLIEKQH